MGFKDFLSGAGDVAKTVGKGALDISPPGILYHGGKTVAELAQGDVGDAYKEMRRTVTPGSEQANNLMQRVFASQMLEKAAGASGRAAFSTPVSKEIGERVFGRDVFGNAGEEFGLSAVNLGRTAAFLSDVDTHAAAIEGAPAAARGAKEAAEFIKEHPRESANIAGTVGKEIIKEELRPENLIQTAVLTAATAGAGTAATKGAKWTGRVRKLAGVAEREAAEVGAQRTALGAADTALQPVFRNPVSARVAESRSKLAERVLAGGEGEAGSLRQAAARLTQGSGGAAPRRLAGQSEESYQQAMNTWRAGRSVVREQQLEHAPDILHATARPEEYAMQQAQGQWAEHGPEIQQRASQEYTERMGGNNLQPQARQNIEQLTEQGQAQAEGRRQTNNVAQPQRQQPGPEAIGINQQQINISDSGVSQPARRNGAFAKGKTTPGTKGQRAWQGPNREAFGGIQADFDWRQFQVRPLADHEWPKRSALYGGDEEEGAAQETGQLPAPPKPLEPANVPAKPQAPQPTKSAAATFSPEMPKSDLYSGVSQGPRIMPAAGASERGAQDGRGLRFKSGQVYGEVADTTIGGTYAWNAKGQGSFAFPELTQPPEAQPRNSAEPNVVKPTPLMRPMTRPLVNRNVKPRQMLGV